MATLAASTVVPQSRPNWFWEFLRDEMQPYPGRVQLVIRMVLAATLSMLICEAYRVPYAFQAPVLALFVSRESTQATLKAVVVMCASLILGAVFVLVSAPFFTVNATLHFIWIGFALFVVFYALSAVNIYAGVLLFSVIITVGLPLWDRAVPAEVNVEDTLWLVWVGIIGVGSTLLVELAFARLRPGDNVIDPLAERLNAVEAVLRCYAEGRAPDHNAIRDINRYVVLGTSLVRRNSQRSGFSLPYMAATGGLIALIGTLVDTTAGLTELPARPSDDERRRARELADHLAQIRSDLLARRVPAPIQFQDLDTSAPGLPLLHELEETVALIPQVFAEPPRAEGEATHGQPPSASLLAHDAFTNPAHLQFGVKGALAAMLCYVLYTSIDWPGISTSVVTCTFTALSTIGSSRQKQVLRILGAAVGGFVFGMGVQIFIFPYVDTIFGFTIVYMIVTAVAAWFMTASPRLSYFGVQVALAFYLIHLQKYSFETSLEIARNRVVGVLLGLFAMWLIFDQLWGRPASIDMRKTFIANLRLLAQLARSPALTDRKESLRQAYALGQTINANFDKVRSLGDGVLFELGPSRQTNLNFRAQINQWQSKLRALFLVRGAMLRYRLEFPGFELPKEMEQPQQEFDEELSASLDGMADRMEEKPSSRVGDLDRALTHVESAAQAHPSPHLSDFLALCRTEKQLATSLAADI
jgi:multidrug resistance protein MdtO